MDQYITKLREDIYTEGAKKRKIGPEAGHTQRVRNSSGSARRAYISSSWARWYRYPGSS